MSIAIPLGSPTRMPGPFWLRRPDEDVASPTRFEVEPLSPTIGAVVRGLDLRDPVDDEVLAELRTAFHAWKVLFFRDQHLTAEQHVALARRFGEVEEHPFIPKGSADTIQRFEKGPKYSGYENEWHNDNTWRLAPSFGSILRAVEVPPVGGDTLFADMGAAYDNLPADVQARIDDLVAEHDWEPTFGLAIEDDARKVRLRAEHPVVHHPVVLRHPATGRRTLFVNRNFTTRIVGMDEVEGHLLLDLLCRQADRAELQCRFRWEPGSIAFWDNLAVQHYAVSDYWPQRRLMERVAIVGTQVGVPAP